MQARNEVGLATSKYKFTTDISGIYTNNVAFEGVSKGVSMDDSLNFSG